MSAESQRTWLPQRAGYVALWVVAAHARSAGRWVAAGVWLLAPLAVAAAPPAATRPTSAGAPRPFQPGLAIDWQRHEVLATGRIVLREGPLEFLACGPGKEHESIVRLDAAAEHLYAALGLAGFTPDTPPRWDASAERFSSPRGDLVSIRVRYQRSGKQQEVGAFDWVREIEYARPARAVPWVFAGSQRVDADHLAAGRSGAYVALVDFPDNLLSLSRRHSNRNAALWAEARTEVIPPLDTPVTLVFAPPRVPRPAMAIDARGDLIVDGRIEPLGAAADLIRMARQLDPQYVQTITTRGALHSDTRRIATALRAALGPATIRLTSAATTTDSRPHAAGPDPEP